MTSRMSASASTSRMVRGATLVGSVALTVTLVVEGLARLSGRHTTLWLLSRASGIAAYVVLVIVVLTGLGLAHPWRVRMRWLSARRRMRGHATLASLTLVLVATHVLAIVADRFAGVGVRGALIPFRSTYRPDAVGLGVIAAWLMITLVATAALAGRLPARAWWPLHKVAVVSLVLTWAHAVLAGTDTPALRALYFGSALLVTSLAFTRYVSPGIRDHRRAARR